MSFFLRTWGPRLQTWLPALARLTRLAPVVAEPRVSVFKNVLGVGKTSRQPWEKPKAPGVANHKPPSQGRATFGIWLCGDAPESHRKTARATQPGSKCPAPLAPEYHVHTLQGETKCHSRLDSLALRGNISSDVGF